MYNQYYNPYSPQVTREKIDGEIAKLQQLKDQLAQNNQTNQTPSINQTFQLAGMPNNGIKYANSIEDVNKEIVYTDTPYFSHDLSVLWLKNAKGNIKVYELKEIVPKDEKDMIIENLQTQINEMREEIKNAKSINANAVEPNESEESTSVSNGRTSKKK